MKNKWKQFSKLQRRMIIYVGLLNVVSVAFQFVSGSWFSWWMAGIGNGAYICFLLDCFGFFIPCRSSSDDGCPMLDCCNTFCPNYCDEYHCCILTETPIDDNTLRYWLSIYERSNGSDAFCELISSVPVSDQEVSGNE